MAKVVLIDDESRLLATLARFVEMRGLEVVRGTSFAEVEQHLRPGRFDVLVTDIVMPDFDGLQVLREVVAERGCQEPVILITGDPNVESASQAVRSGAFDYIRKPVTKARLLDGIERGIRHVRLLRERDEARQREMQLLKNLAEIGESASVLTHEIKTPLNGLRHAIEAVGDRLGVEDSVVIDEFVTSLTRIERMLGQTLSFAKPLDLRLARTSLRRLVDGVVAECRQLDCFAGAEVDVQIDRDVLVDVDPDIFAEVISNLLRNAAEARAVQDPAGSVRVELVGRCVPDAVQIDVADDGPGVAEDLRDSIFKPFRTSKKSGTGIGLPFSRKIVEAHGGRIDLVRSDRRGAHFRIELPLPRDAQPGDSGGGGSGQADMRTPGAPTE